jgi:hypothetical protein
LRCHLFLALTLWHRTRLASAEGPRWLHLLPRVERRHNYGRL